MLDAKLIVVGGVADQKEVNLKSLPLTIGRGREATLTLSHSLVSRSHCKIFADKGLLQVEDLNSLNGTYVNNKKIDGIQTLEPGQLLTLGNVTFRAVYGTEDKPQAALRGGTASSADTDASGMELDTDHGGLPHSHSLPRTKIDTDWVPDIEPAKVDPVSVDSVDGAAAGKNDNVSISAIQRISDAQTPASVDPNSIRIDVGEVSPAKVDDSALESFIRKAR